MKGGEGGWEEEKLSGKRKNTRKAEGKGTSEKAMRTQKEA